MSACAIPARHSCPATSAPSPSPRSPAHPFFLAAAGARGRAEGRCRQSRSAAPSPVPQPDRARPPLGRWPHLCPNMSAAESAGSVREPEKGRGAAGKPAGDSYLVTAGGSVPVRGARAARRYSRPVGPTSTLQFANVDRARAPAAKETREAVHPDRSSVCAMTKTGRLASASAVSAVIRTTDNGGYRASSGRGDHARVRPRSGACCGVQCPCRERRPACRLGRGRPASRRGQDNSASASNLETGRDDAKGCFGGRNARCC